MAKYSHEQWSSALQSLKDHGHRVFISIVVDGASHVLSFEDVRIDPTHLSPLHADLSADVVFDVVDMARSASYAYRRRVEAIMQMRADLDDRRPRSR